MNTIASPSSVTVALHELEANAKTYATAREILSERVGELTAEIQDAHRRKVPGIKRALAIAKDAQAKLAASVQEHPELFAKPRTMTLHGIKFGYAKGTGRIEWDCDDEVLVSRIEKQFAGDDRLALLVNTIKLPAKAALKDLDVKELARLGVTIESTGDYVIVKASDGAVDKLVKRILAEGAVEEAAGS